jgi:uncharacterized protein
MVAKFEISKDPAGKFRFHLKAPNGEIIAASQGYDTKANAERALRRSKRRRPARSGGSHRLVAKPSPLCSELL